MADHGHTSVDYLIQPGHTNSARKCARTHAHTHTRSHPYTDTETEPRTRPTHTHAHNPYKRTERKTTRTHPHPPHPPSRTQADKREACAHASAYIHNPIKENRKINENTPTSPRKRRPAHKQTSEGHTNTQAHTLVYGTEGHTHT